MRYFWIDDAKDVLSVGGLSKISSQEADSATHILLGLKLDLKDIRGIGLKDKLTSHVTHGLSTTKSKPFSHSFSEEHTKLNRHPSLTGHSEIRLPYRGLNIPSGLKYEALKNVKEQRSQHNEIYFLRCWFCWR
jgi:hypothetical protein